MISIFLNIVSVFTTKKSVFALFFNMFSFIFNIGWCIANKVLSENYDDLSANFSFGFYLAIVICILILTYIIVYSLYKKGKIHFVKPTFPKRPHKPTKAERISELEKQVAELKVKNGGGDD